MTESRTAVESQQPSKLRGIRPIVRAIDLGYGAVKFSVNLTDQNKIICDSFLSMAPQASGKSISVAGTLGKKSTVTVKVGGNYFEVGRDAQLSSTGANNVVISENYCETPEYMALTLGAISYMGVPNIDLHLNVVHGHSKLNAGSGNEVHSLSHWIEKSRSKR